MGRDTFSFDLNCSNASISPNGNRLVAVTLDEVEKSDVLDLFDIPEAIDHFGSKDIIGYLDEAELEKWAEANGYAKEK